MRCSKLVQMSKHCKIFLISDQFYNQTTNLNQMALTEQGDPQVLLFPTAGPLGPNLTTAAAPEDTQGDEDSAGQAEADELPQEVQTNGPKVMEPETPAPEPSRGDGPQNEPQVRYRGLLQHVMDTYYALHA